MNMSSFNIKKDFNNLKHSARSDNDVVNWFVRHPNMIPRLPDEFTPDVILNIVKERTYTAYNNDATGIMHWITIDYKAQLPALVESSIDDISFEFETGHAITTELTQTQRANYAGRFKLALDPAEWPYIASTMLLAALNKDKPATELFCRLSQRTWLRAYPDLPWETLDNLYNAGVLPNTVTELTDWLPSVKSKVATSELPTNLSM